MNVVVLIPAYNPENLLIPLVESLIALGFRQVVVVNDGSDSSCQPIFAQLARMERCKVLHHMVNLGKGRALKTGFNACRLLWPDSAAMVTADADGQHLPADIKKVADTFLDNRQSIIIGARQFNGQTPMRSLLGNRITRSLFRLLLGWNLSDTQSGLRCLPMSLVPELVRLSGERYEYELNVLLWARSNRTRVRVREVAINTVYLQENRSSHFNPLMDSMRIIFLLLRFFTSDYRQEG